MKIIFNDCVYTIVALQLANLPPLAERRDQLTRRFFDKMCDVNNCLQLPAACPANSLRTAQRCLYLCQIHAFQKLIYPLCLGKLSAT